MAARSRQQRARKRLARIAVLGVAGVLVGGCGGNAGGGNAGGGNAGGGNAGGGNAASPTTTAASQTTTETSPDNVDPGVLRPEYAGLDRYERRCEKLDLEGARARVVYEASTEMDRGDSDTVTAAVTLDQSVPADEVLRRPGAVEEPGVVVSCRIQARLSAPDYEFEIDETGWVKRSLLTTDTARWSWYVTPKLGGTHSLVLDIRPIMAVQPADDTAKVLARAESSNVQQYETSVHVNVPWNERPAEFMTRLASIFDVAEGLVQGLTALVLALGGLGLALGIKKRRDKHKRATP